MLIVFKPLQCFSHAHQVPVLYLSGDLSHSSFSKSSVCFYKDRSMHMLLRHETMSSYTIIWDPFLKLLFSALFWTLFSSKSISSFLVLWLECPRFSISTVLCTSCDSSWRERKKKKNNNEISSTLGGPSSHSSDQKEGELVTFLLALCAELWDVLPLNGGREIDGKEKYKLTARSFVLWVLIPSSFVFLSPQRVVISGRDRAACACSEEELKHS